MAVIIDRIEFFPGRGAIDGLGAFKIDRIGSKVLFSGRNGSGKTRILQGIRSAIQASTSLNRKDSGYERGYQASYDSKEVQRLREEMDEINKKIAALSESDTADRRETPPLVNRLRQVQNDLAGIVAVDFRTQRSGAGINVIEIKPVSNHDFRDPLKTTLEEKNEVVKSLDSIFDKFSSPSDSLIRLNVIHDNYILSTHPKSDLENLIKGAYHDRYNSLKELLSRVANISLESDARLEPTLDRLSLYDGSTRLSNGQKRILDIASNTDIGNTIDDPTIFIIDEPELYIHPAALTEMFNIIENSFPRSQMFIATHSVPLIAHLGYENVWWVQDGVASYAGKAVYTVLESLLGGFDNIQKLHDITLAPSRLASLRFASECLLSPNVISAKKGDPQGQQLASFISRKLADNKEILRILDYGAGKARLLPNLSDELGSNLFEKISYFAYEPNPSHSERAVSLISEYYSDSEERYFSEISSLTRRLSSEKIDIAVMCNVLHEIEPTEWKGVFRGISKIIDPAGGLLIIEDSEIPHGELAHSAGFIISDDVALQKLFLMPKPPENYAPADKRYYGRLFAYFIPSLHTSCDNYDIIGALNWIRDQSLSKIEEIRRKQKPGYGDGHRHGLYVEQFVNATIALSKT